ncbi:MAG: DMT family transporter, partial [Gorillibacterium sp.]|nr:DMT family transporter [Gorillibacterium sp.]
CIVQILLRDLLYILVTSWAAKVTDALTLGIMQLGFTSAYGLFFSLLFEHPQMPNNTKAWVAVLALSILCSGLGFILMPIAQQYTTPTHTGLIFALEPVFAVFFGMMFAGEIIPLKGYVGAAFMLLGVLAAEVKRQRVSP